MPAPATVVDFLDIVRKSGLVPNEHLSRYSDGVSSPDRSLDQLADQLVRDGLLTFFQAKQLKLGRYKRFQIAGKYRLLELLGVGGMGAVYLCEHEFMKRLVAVKVLPVDKISSDPTALDRFYREARAVAALDHPNIVRAFDIDKFESVHFLVMEYVDGNSLQEIVTKYVQRKQFYDPVRAAHAIAQAAAGLQHASDLGIVHRDIKPGNLLLDRRGTIKVLDMGLARFFDHRNDNLTARLDDKCVLGTADYLAPEQATNDPIDVRADIYGLGGTLYFLLTGRSPFPDGTVAQKLVAHQTQKPKAVRQFRSDVPAGLLAVLEKMMEKKPANRYQTPMDVMAALEPWTSQPIDVPAHDDMPILAPAVLQRMGENPIAGRLSQNRARTASTSNSGVYDTTPTSGSNNMVPTTKAADTAPIRPGGVPTDLPKTPSVSRRNIATSDVWEANINPDPVDLVPGMLVDDSGFVAPAKKSPMLSIVIGVVSFLVALGVLVAIFLLNR
jgi:eukaryotic-like serine/threonine-protein kinase